MKQVAPAAIEQVARPQRRQLRTNKIPGSAGCRAAALSAPPPRSSIDSGCRLRSTVHQPSLLRPTAAGLFPLLRWYGCRLRSNVFPEAVSRRAAALSAPPSASARSSIGNGGLMLSNMFPEAVGCRAAALSAPPPASARSSVGRDATGRPYAAVRQLLLSISSH